MVATPNSVFTNFIFLVRRPVAISVATHSFSLLFFGAGLGGCFASNCDYFVDVLPFNLVVSRCFTSALIGGELCALKRRLEAKLLALGLCILAARW